MRKETQKRGPRQTPFWITRREGAGQVVLIGPPNAGKSRLVASLTHAHPEVADYPFTTHRPVPGILEFEKVPIQLVDLPPISADFTERWIPQVIRTADLGILVVDLNDGALLEEIEFVLDMLKRNRLRVPKLIAGNKADLPGSKENLRALGELYGDRFEYMAISALTGENLDRLARYLFDALDIVRFYSKPPGKHADLSKPYVVKRGDTVVDAARVIHKDFAERMKFTRLYRADGEHSGLMVERHHVVKDEDIFEFHI
jgi:hypothetical protein